MRSVTFGFSHPRSTMTTPESGSSDRRPMTTTLGKDNKDVFLSDVSARYKFKKVNLELIVNNITNLDRYVKEEISNLMESRTVYKLRPREVLLKLSWVM